MLLENSIEWNSPYYCFPLIPLCSPDFDVIGKMYFDRGIWDRRSCMHQIGCISGTPTFFSHNSKQHFANVFLIIHYFACSVV